MENENEEVLETEAPEAEVEETKEEEIKEEETSWEERAKELEGINKRLKTKLAKNVQPEKKEIKSNKKTSELDYGQLGYLAAKGIESDEEINFLQNVISKTGDDLRVVLKDDFVQHKLKAMKESKELAKAMPTGTKRGSSSSHKDTVEYWIAKGELPPIDNPKLRREYVNAKLKQETDGSKFSSNPVVQ